jgi:hypothetical protein
MEHSRDAQGVVIGRQGRVKELAPPGVEPVIGSHCPGKVPGVHQDIAGQVRYQRARIELSRLITRQFRYVNDSFQHAPTGLECLFQLVVGQLPSELRVIAWSIGLQPQRPQHKHVMKTDHVLEYSSGIPRLTWRASIPLSFCGTHCLTEPSAHRQVPFG